MMLKMIGATLIVIGCSAFGLIMVRNHRREVFALEQLIAALDYMLSQLHYQLTPLPELAGKAAEITKGVVGKVFLDFAAKLAIQISPSPELCMDSVLETTKDIPSVTKECLKSFSLTLGKFDLEGQENSLEILRCTCRRKLEDYTKDQDIRLRSYRTLGVCAGVALMILFI